MGYNCKPKMSSTTYCEKIKWAVIHNKSFFQKRYTRSGKASLLRDAIGNNQTSHAITRMLNTLNGILVYGDTVR